MVEIENAIFPHKQKSWVIYILDSETLLRPFSVRMGTIHTVQNINRINRINQSY